MASDVIPAATLVIVRERTEGAPELLMVERNGAMAFAPGAMVFPGGRIDPSDHALAAAIGGDASDLPARIAAIRETIEEAGVPIGLTMPAAGAVAGIRAKLHAGMAFGAALSQAGARLDPDALIPFARWRPAHATMRIFDTHFYLARLPDDASPASVDATENVRLIWVGAQAILDDADAGRATIIFPTRRTLERLAKFTNFDAAAADARTYPMTTITPWIETRDGTPHLCIPEGCGYPITSEPLAAATRG